MSRTWLPLNAQWLAATSVSLSSQDTSHFSTAPLCHKECHQVHRDRTWTQPSQSLNNPEILDSIK